MDKCPSLIDKGTIVSCTGLYQNIYILLKIHEANMLNRSTFVIEIDGVPTS